MLDKPSKSLSDMIASINADMSGDHAYICAAASNLYMEASRRLFGRKLMSAGDFIAMMKIIDLLTNAQVTEPKLSPKPDHALSAEQEAELLKGIGDLNARRD
jgi:hypothetical protein